jgi:hypothetical protein
MSRFRTTITKIPTPFGGMFFHLDIDKHGRVAGGQISHKGKDLDSQVTQLVEALSSGIDEALASSGGKVIWWRRLFVRRR